MIFAAAAAAVVVAVAVVTNVQPDVATAVSGKPCRYLKQVIQPIFQM